MLNEVLLALSGHPSPLFPASTKGDVPDGKSGLVDQDFPLLSPSEAALLERVGRLAVLHRQLRVQAKSIISQQNSIICRAVASSIFHTHLARFQEKILEVERRILTKDADLVGAYNIVPLSAVVGEFAEWSRRMEWYWRLVCYMHGPEGPSGKQVTGAQLIDHLRSESHTGFPDVEAVSIELGQVAEKAWLKQLSMWLLYGQIPTHGASDFFVTVHESASHEELDQYLANRTLLPDFVSRRTAGSLMFIGKSLHQVKRHRQSSAQLSGAEGMADAELLSEHLRLLSALTLPLIASTFSTTVSRIRSSLSQNVLHRLLPIEEVKLSLNVFRQFFLLDRGEFATTLVEEAQERLNSRRGDVGRFAHDDPTKNLHGVLIKEGEVNEALGRTWKVLTIAQVEDAEDDVLEFAREYVGLEIVKGADSRPSTSDSTVADMPQLSTVLFNDLLFPVQTWLTMHIRSPLDLFISKHDISVYASINAYLVALRRSHMHLSDLWRLSGARREDARASPATRRRVGSRVAATRKVWATCSAAVFLLTETTAYFEGEVIKGSWDHFFQWVVEGRAGAAHDPETLSTAHRRFLSCLVYGLLLTDVKYTKTLRTLLGNTDSLAANFSRLQQVQRTLDMDTESGVASTYAQEEEQSIKLELDRARKRVDSGLKDVVARLRQLDDERTGEAMFRGLRLGDEGDEEQAFEAWRGGGVERLLMKLDFGRITEDEMISG